MTTYNTQVGTFLRAHKGQNKRALEITLLGIDHMLDNRFEWTGVARLISGVEPRMAKMIRRILGATVGGLTIASDVKQPTGLRIKAGANAAATEKLDELRALVSAGESIYGEKVQKLVGLGEAEARKFDAEKRFLALATAAVDADMNEEQALHYMKEAMRKARVAAAAKAEKTAEPAF